MSQMESIASELESQKKETIASNAIKFKVVSQDHKPTGTQRVATIAEAKRYHYKVK